MEISSDHRPPQVNEVIEIAMRDEKKKQDIVAIGRVAWVREKEGQEGFEVGVMLTYVKNEDQERFKEYLEDSSDLEEINSHESPYLRRK